MNVETIIIPQSIEDKLASKHNVTRKEVEQVFAAEPRFRFAQKGNVRGENLYRAIGQSDGGRFLVIFFILKANRAALVISARDLTSAERKHYGQK